MSRERTQAHVNALFGSTNVADSVPDTDAASSEQIDPGDEPAGEQSGCDFLQSVLSPSPGPVYLEGRLVLALSFQPIREQAEWLDTMMGRLGEQGPPRRRRGKPLERYRIWDELAGDWLAGSPTVLRFENTDVVERGEASPMPVWTGAVDVRKRVIAVPDLDRAGIVQNLQHDLRWKLYDA